MIELSIMDHGAACTEAVRAAVRQFEAETREPVTVRVLPWRGAWAELVKVGLYNDGPNVSEIGSTWLSEFVGMNALRPFVSGEVARLGGPLQFLSEAWGSTAPHGKSHTAFLTWAIPWLADIRLLHYRQDWLDRARVDPETLTTAEALRQACERLKAAGVANPIVFPTRRSRLTLHNLACWVWGAGGDFLSPDLKKPAFHLAEAKAGLYAYFDLVRYLAPELRQQDETHSDAIFAGGRAAMTVSGPWLRQGLRRAAGLSADTAPRMRQILPPGVPWVGGSHLVIWKHTYKPERAVALVRHLVSADMQANLAVESGLLPTRTAVFTRQPFAADPFYQTAHAGLQTGRSFPTFGLWGLIESRLTDAITAIWDEILATPHPDVPAIVDRSIDETASRLSATLTNY